MSAYYYIGLLETNLKKFIQISALSGDVQTSVNGARLSTLYMCIEFYLGNLEQAMRYYDAAREV